MLDAQLVELLLSWHRNVGERAFSWHAHSLMHSLGQGAGAISPKVQNDVLVSDYPHMHQRRTSWLGFLACKPPVRGVASSAAGSGRRAAAGPPSGGTCSKGLSPRCDGADASCFILASICAHACLLRYCPSHELHAHTRPTSFRNDITGCGIIARPLTQANKG